MLEKPDIQDHVIIECIRENYGLAAHQIAFLPIGADLNTAVYRIGTNDQKDYFVKLRRGVFGEASVNVPAFLHQSGVRQVIPAVQTLGGELWAGMPPFNVIVYPYVQGLNGFEKGLSDAQWAEFGAAMKQFHTLQFPPAVTGGVESETYSPRWSDTVRSFLGRVGQETFSEDIAAQTAAFLKSEDRKISQLLEKTENLAARLLEKPREFVLCHADIHAWNLLLDEQGGFYIVDWDTLIFAPKERDLMFIGSGLGGGQHPPEKEEALFYTGYGDTRVDPQALAYYRYERIIEDLAVFCEQIFLSEVDGEDRKQALVYLKSNFLPGNTIELAQRSDRTS